MLGVMTLLALVAWATPTYSSPAILAHPRLKVESCLVEGTSTFRLRAANGPTAGEWRLQLHLGTEIINFGYLEANEEVGGFGPDATITTTIEGTWEKQFLEGTAWVNRNGAHSLSVEGHTQAGLSCPTYELGDLVWYDTNQDGIQDAGEPGIEGIEVELYDDATCSGTLVFSDTTDASGNYLFTDLDPRDYCLGFVNIPMGWHVPLQNQGGDDSVDSDAVSVTARIEDITLAADDYDEDIGLHVDGSIGDRVWCDFDGNSAYDLGEGMDDITVWLYEDPNCDRQEDALLGTLDTAGDGEYYFTDLNTGPPGSTNDVCYVVMVNAYDEDLGACTLPLADLVFGLLLNADAPNVDTGDFGFREGSGVPGPYRTYCPLVTRQH